MWRRSPVPSDISWHNLIFLHGWAHRSWGFRSSRWRVPKSKFFLWIQHTWRWARWPEEAEFPEAMSEISRKALHFLNVSSGHSWHSYYFQIFPCSALTVPVCWDGPLPSCPLASQCFGLLMKPPCGHLKNKLLSKLVWSHRYVIRKGPHPLGFPSIQILCLKLFIHSIDCLGSWSPKLWLPFCG